jgi:hypothetical protein
MASSGLYSAATSGDRNDSDSSGDFLKLLCQSYFLCFNDEHASFPNTLYKLFKGELNKTIDSGDFVTSSDNSVLQMKNIILQSLRTAFHYSQEALIMGEFDVPESHKDFEVNNSFPSY